VASGLNYHEQVRLEGNDRLTMVELTAILRAMQYAEPDRVFESPFDRAAFGRANRKLARVWNQLRLSREQW